MWPVRPFDVFAPKDFEVMNYHKIRSQHSIQQWCSLSYSMGGHFTHILENTWMPVSYHFTKKDVKGPQNKLNPATFLNWSACIKPGSEQSWICVLEVSMLPACTIFPLDSGIILTVFICCVFPFISNLWTYVYKHTDTFLNVECTFNINVEDYNKR
jgi:hypothetical protein